MDLSNNKFTKKDCLAISEALLVNRKLIGLHFDGGLGYIDNKGFLKVDEEIRQA